MKTESFSPFEFYYLFNLCMDKLQIAIPLPPAQAETDARYYWSCCEKCNLSVHGEGARESEMRNERSAAGELVPKGCFLLQLCGAFNGEHVNGCEVISSNNVVSRQARDSRACCGESSGSSSSWPHGIGEKYYFRNCGRWDLFLFYPCPSLFFFSHIHVVSLGRATHFLSWFDVTSRFTDCLPLGNPILQWRAFLLPSLLTRSPQTNCHTRRMTK